MDGKIYAFITCTRVKWEEDVATLAADEGVTPDEIRQQYSTGWSVDGRTGEITYNDDGSGDYNASNDTVRMEDAVEEHGWIDRSWSTTTLHDSRNDVRPIVEGTYEDLDYLKEDVLDALGWLEGGYNDNGDGTFYAAESYQPFTDPWDYSYAIHFTRKFQTSEGWTEEPWTPPFGWLNK